MPDNPFSRFAPSAPSRVPGTITDVNPFAQFVGNGSGPSLDYYNSFAGGDGKQPSNVDPVNSDDSRSFALTPRTSQPTPDAGTWWGRRVQDIEGKQDPQFADIPSVFSQNRDQLQAPMGTASMLGADDDQMSDVVKKQLGDRYLSTFRDANGFPIVQFKDASTGEPKLGYVNRPGLDSEDVVRGVKSSLPYAAGAAILGPFMEGLPLLSRVLMSGTAGGLTSAAGDKLMNPLGNEQGVQFGKAATMATMGALGELGSSALSSLWQRFVEVPKYFDKSTGQLTPLGKQAAQSMGLDPDQMLTDAASTFGKTYAMSPADAKAAVDAGNFDFNIPATRGQVAKDPQLLLQEKAMRSGLYGLEAKNQIEDLDRQQADAVATALTDTIPSRLAGQRWRGGSNSDVYGDNIGMNLADARTNAKAAERSAWGQTGPLVPKTTTATAPDAMTPLTGVERSTSTMQGADLLRDTLHDNLSDYAGVLSPENTPATFKMWQYLNDFVSGKKPNTALHQQLGLSGARDVDTVRRGLGLMLKDASTPTDQMTAKAVYRSFNDWLDKAAQENMLAGDPVGATKLKIARDVSAEINSIFKPRLADGQLTPGGKVLERIAQNANTPERIVDALLPSANGSIPPGTIEALGLIRKGMQKYGNQGADAQVWNSIKMAYLSKLTQGANGEFLSPQVMSQNLKKAINSQTSLYNAIFTPADRVVLQRFLNQLNRISWKDPNPSGTATSLASLGKQLFGKLLDAFGPVGNAAWHFSGVQNAWGTSIARQAVKQAPPALPAPMRNAAGGYANAVTAPLFIQGREPRR